MLASMRGSKSQSSTNTSIGLLSSVVGVKPTQNCGQSQGSFPLDSIEVGETGVTEGTSARLCWGASRDCVRVHRAGRILRSEGEIFFLRSRMQFSSIGSSALVLQAASSLCAAECRELFA